MVSIRRALLPSIIAAALVLQGCALVNTPKSRWMTAADLVSATQRSLVVCVESPPCAEKLGETGARAASKATGSAVRVLEDNAAEPSGGLLVEILGYLTTANRELARTGSEVN